MPSLKHVTGSKQLQFLPPLLYFDKFFCPAAFPKTYERAAVGIYLPPVPPLSTLAPSLLPAPSLPQHICAVGRIYSCRKYMSLSERYFFPQHIFRPLPTRPAQNIFLLSTVQQITLYLHILPLPVRTMTIKCNWFHFPQFSNNLHGKLFRIPFPVLKRLLTPCAQTPRIRISIPWNKYV